MNKDSLMKKGVKLDFKSIAAAEGGLNTTSKIKDQVKILYIII